MPKTDVHAHFIRRLKQARTAMGLSQTALGVRMGLTDDIASTRINRYEVGTSEPDLRTAERMAKELGVSLSWLVCTDPKLAELIDGFSKLDVIDQDALLSALKLALRKSPKKSTRVKKARGGAAARVVKDAVVKAPRPIKAKSKSNAKKTGAKNAGPTATREAR